MAADGNGSESDTPMKNSMDADLLQTLQTLKKQDPKIQDIIEHLQESPSELLEMLSKNLDMLDFVLEYPNKKGEVFSDTNLSAPSAIRSTMGIRILWGRCDSGKWMRSYLPVYGDCWANRQKHHYPLYNSQLCRTARILCS